MNTKTRITRFIFTLALVLSILGLSTSTALANQPNKFSATDTWYNQETEACPFSVNVASKMQVTEQDFFEHNGGLSRITIHIREQDTFTANGKTINGDPYRFNLKILFDSSGNITHVYASGIVSRFPLPDGSEFISAGRLDFVVHSSSIVISPDKGNPGDVAAYCAALAP